MVDEDKLKKYSSEMYNMLLLVQQRLRELGYGVFGLDEIIEKIQKG